MRLPKLGNNPYRKWTKEELQKLQTLSNKKTITELAKYFKTTNEAICTVASRNNIELMDEKIQWTEKENTLLEKYAETMDIFEISKKMNKSTSSIRLQAQRKGIIVQKNKDHQNSIWTDKNDEQLKQLVDEGKTLIEIVTIMNKKDETILKKAKKLGLEMKQEKEEKWSEDESLKLMELAKTKTLSEIVKELGRTSASIRTQAKKLEIKIIPDRKGWTKEEFEILEHAVKVDKKDPKEIAKMLGRTEEAIKIKLNRMGIKAKIGNKKFWTEEEENLLTDLWGEKSLEIIAKELERTISSVRNKAVQLQLGSQSESNYDGVKIQDICDLLQVRPETVSINWVALGLQIKTRKISKVTSYKYVEINDLYHFLKQNQNIWNSKVLEKNILGVEPDWLKEKRKLDRELKPDTKPLNLTKQQLILARKFFLKLQEESKENQEPDGNSLQLSLKRGKRK